MAAQAAAADQEVEGVAGGGVVRIRATGSGQVRRRRHRLLEVVDPADVAMLEDLVRAPPSTTSNARLAEVQRAGPRPLGGLARCGPGPARAASRVANVYPLAVQELIDELGRLPGIGPKSAQRIAFHLLKLPSIGRAAAWRRPSPWPRSRVTLLLPLLQHRRGGGATRPVRASAPTTAATPRCVCVVEEPRDIVAVEKTRRVPRPLPRAPGRHQPDRRRRPRPAADPRAAGAASTPRACRRSSSAPTPTSRARPPPCTSAGCSRPLGLKVTRIASGLPVGGDLEYADELTLGRALEGRRGRRLAPRAAAHPVTRTAEAKQKLGHRSSSGRADRPTTNRCPRGVCDRGQWVVGARVVAHPIADVAVTLRSLRSHCKPQ